MSYPVWVVSDSSAIGHLWREVAGVFPIDREKEAREFASADPSRRLHPGSVDEGVTFNLDVTVPCEKASSNSASLLAGSAE